jgi:hypothetical protein
VLEHSVAFAAPHRLKNWGEGSHGKIGNENSHTRICGTDRGIVVRFPVSSVHVDRLDAHMAGLLLWAGCRCAGNSRRAAGVCRAGNRAAGSDDSAAGLSTGSRDGAVAGRAAALHSAARADVYAASRAVVRSADVHAAGRTVVRSADVLSAGRTVMRSADVLSAGRTVVRGSGSRIHSSTRVRTRVGLHKSFPIVWCQSRLQRRAVVRCQSRVRVVRDELPDANRFLSNGNSLPHHMGSGPDD